MSVVLPRKRVPPPQVEASLIDFMKTHRSGVWKISEDSYATTATCVLCAAAAEERAATIPNGKQYRKRKERLAYNVSLALKLNGPAALWGLHQHEVSLEHIANLHNSEVRHNNHRPIPDELWRNSSFICGGINFSTVQAIGLEAYHVGGCLGMSAVAAFSRRL